MDTQIKYPDFLTSDDLIRFYKHDQIFCEVVFDTFGFLVKHCCFLVKYIGLPRGWGITFKKDYISVVVGYAVDEIEPSIWISREDSKTYAQRNIEDLMNDIKYEPKEKVYKYTEKYKTLGFFKSIFFKRKYKKNLRDEFWQKIKDSGNFFKNHFDEIIKIIDDAGLRERKTYLGYYSHNQASVADGV